MPGNHSFHIQQLTTTCWHSRLCYQLVDQWYSQSKINSHLPGLDFMQHSAKHLTSLLAIVGDILGDRFTLAAVQHRHNPTSVLYKRLNDLLERKHGSTTGFLPSLAKGQYMQYLPSRRRLHRRDWWCIHERPRQPSTDVRDFRERQ
jgi:hypothetical protein